jgi:hypothetical protein
MFKGALENGGLAGNRDNRIEVNLLISKERTELRKLQNI